MSETVVGEKGMVTAPHRAASEAGAEVLRAGGNALEAMIAAAATIAVVYPHMNGIGGDVFMVVAEPGRAPRSVDACGRAGTHAHHERYRKAGHDTVPARGALAAVTVPGAVSAWTLAAEMSAARGGRIPRADLLAAAIRHAREGISVSRSQARLAEKFRDELAAAPGFADIFLVEGKAPAVGHRMAFPRLADTLDQLAHAGFDDFYRGDVAAEIAADLAAAGAPVTREDLAAQVAILTTPLTTELRSATLWNTPPPTQGIAALIILGLFDRLGVTRAESFAHIHGLIEAAKRAARVRDAEVTDPDHARDLSEYLAPAWLDREAKGIDMRRASPWGGKGVKGDTVWMGAIDRDGLAVSFIQSLYWEFGSGVALPRTGVLMQNRGSSFSLDPAAKNPLLPGRKPFHTLNPAYARFRDGRSMVYGSMGGDGQPQFQAQVFARHALFGVDLGEAIAAPRFRLGITWGRQAAELLFENRFDPDLLAELTRAGHEVTVSPEAYLDGMGHAGAIVRDRNGRFSGASDPRSDGAAVAA